MAFTQELIALLQSKPELLKQLYEAWPKAPSPVPSEEPVPTEEKPYRSEELIRDFKIACPKMIRYIEGVLYRGLRFEDYEVHIDGVHGKGTIFRFLVDLDSDEAHPPRLFAIFYPAETEGLPYTIQVGYVNSAAYSFMVRILKAETQEELVNPVFLFEWITQMDRHFLKAHVPKGEEADPTPQQGGAGNTNVNNNDVNLELTVNVNSDGEVQVNKKASTAKTARTLLRILAEREDLRDPELVRLLWRHRQR